jgi:hypothetical protein
MAAENGQIGAQRANAHPPDPASSFSLDGVSPIQCSNHFAFVSLSPLHSG